MNSFAKKSEKDFALIFLVLLTFPEDISLLKTYIHLPFVETTTITIAKTLPFELKMGDAFYFCSKNR